MINWLSLHVDEVLLARGAGLRSEMFLAEHGIFLIFFLLLGEQLHDFLKLLAQLCETLQCIVLVRELFQERFDHFLQLVEEPVLHINEVLLVRLMRHLVHQIRNVLLRIVPVLLKFSPQLGELITQSVDLLLIRSASVRLLWPAFQFFFKVSVGHFERAVAALKLIHPVLEHVKIVHRRED